MNKTDLLKELFSLNGELISNYSGMDMNTFQKVRAISKRLTLIIEEVPNMEE